MERFPYAWALFMVATFTMLNLFIAIIVNAMQSYTETEHETLVGVVEEARDHIETDLHEEVRLMRAEIGELKALLIARVGSTPDQIRP